MEITTVIEVETLEVLKEIRDALKANQRPRLYGIWCENEDSHGEWYDKDHRGSWMVAMNGEPISGPYGVIAARITECRDLKGNQIQGLTARALPTEPEKGQL